MRMLLQRPIAIVALVFAGSFCAASGFVWGRGQAQGIPVQPGNVINIPLALYEPGAQNPSVTNSVATTVDPASIDQNSAYMAQCVKPGAQPPECSPGDILVCRGRKTGVLDRPNPLCNRSQTYEQAKAASCLESSWVDCSVTWAAYPWTVCMTWTNVGGRMVMTNTTEAECFKPLSTISSSSSSAVCGPSKCSGVTCPAIDQCHRGGTCDAATGLCSNPTAPNGTKCDDGEMNTVNDQCLQGTCIGTKSCQNVVCYQLDQCHKPGTCDPSTALCANPVLPNGTPCDDGYQNTVNDSCTDGVCYGDPSCGNVTCTPADDCHFAGACDPSTGQCSDNPKPDGTKCDDGYPSTVNDRCQSGVCQGTFSCQGYQCAPPDQCQFPGVCNINQWGCTYASRPDGTSCDDGSVYTKNDKCVQGYCQGTLTCSAVTCTAQDQCHYAGSCDPSSVTCSNPEKPDGTSCDDADPSTTGDTCMKGVCSGVARACNTCVPTVVPLVSYAPPVVPLPPDTCGDGLCGPTEKKGIGAASTTTCAKDCGTVGGSTCPTAFPYCDGLGLGANKCGSNQTILYGSFNYQNCAGGKGQCYTCAPFPPNYDNHSYSRVCYMPDSPENFGICCGNNKNGQPACELGSSYCACQASTTLRNPVFFQEHDLTLEGGGGTDCRASCPFSVNSQCITNCINDSARNVYYYSMADTATAACINNCVRSIGTECASCYLSFAQGAHAPCVDATCSTTCDSPSPDVWCRIGLPVESETGPLGEKNLNELFARYRTEPSIAFAAYGTYYDVLIPASDPAIHPPYKTGSRWNYIRLPSVGSFDPYGQAIPVKCEGAGAVSSLISSANAISVSSMRGTSSMQASSLALSSVQPSSARASSAQPSSAKASSSAAAVRNSLCALSTDQAVVTAGKTFTATFVLANTGNVTWLAGEGKGHDLLMSNEPNDNMIFGKTTQRFMIPGDVSPGATVTVVATLNAPLQTGTRSIVYQMGLEGTARYGQLCKTSIIVVAPASSSAMSSAKASVASSSLSSAARSSVISPVSRSSSPVALSSVSSVPTAAAMEKCKDGNGNILGIAADVAGKIWFTMPEANLIGVRSPSGTVRTYPLPKPNSAPGYIAAGPDGNMWFTEQVGSAIGKITPEGVITEFPLTSIFVHSTGPTVIVRGPDGNMWFTEQITHSVGKITPKGGITRYSGFSQPYGLTVGADGNLWFSESGANAVVRLSTGGVSKRFPLPTPGRIPGLLARGPDGNLWLTALVGNIVAKITTSGTVTEYAIPTQDSYPSGIVGGLDGNVWFGEVNAARIARITPSGSIIEYPLPRNYTSPSGFTLGSDAVWFGESYGGRIGKIDSGGTITEYQICSM